MEYLPQVATALVDTIDAAQAADQDRARTYLGASVMGKECMRAVWYQLRWAVEVKFEGRLIRLFTRGHREEEQFAAILRKIGAIVHTVDPSTGKQFSHSRIGGHMRGSQDARIENLPTFDRSWTWLGEWKTHKDEIFRQVQKNGVRIAKPEHYTQAQLYMHWDGLERCLYGAVNKDTDELYFETFDYDREFCEDAERRGHEVIFSEELPPRMHGARDASFFKCKMCRASDLCHGKAFAQVNCRTCAHSTPELNGNGRWSCSYWKENEIPADAQRKGCDHHVYNPAFLVNHGKYVTGDSELNFAEYERPDGSVFRNGTKRENPLVWPSTELPHVPEKLDAAAELLRQTFGGTYVAVTELTPQQKAANEQLVDYLNQPARASRGRR